MDTANPQASQGGTEDEYLIAEWQEPVQKNIVGSSSSTAIIFVTCVLVLILILAGYFLKDKDYYFACVASIAICTTLIAQKKSTHIQHDVMLTNLRLKLGNKVYLLTGMAGFWIDSDTDYTVINIEPKKPTAFPISTLYPELAEAKLRELFLQVLPEVESRKKDITDQINQFLRL